jgi:hypothetical protein
MSGLVSCAGLLCCHGMHGIVQKGCWCTRMELVLVRFCWERGGAVVVCCGSQVAASSECWIVPFTSRH